MARAEHLLGDGGGGVIHGRERAIGATHLEAALAQHGNACGDVTSCMRCRSMYRTAGVSAVSATTSWAPQTLSNRVLMAGSRIQARPDSSQGMRARSCAPTFSIGCLRSAFSSLCILAAALVLRDPLTRKFAFLDLREDLAHFLLGRLVDDARAARQVAVFGGLADELVHLGDAAFVQQVDDQLQLVQALVVGDFGLVAGLHQGLEALHHQLGRAAAQHRLLAEQIGFGLFRERRLEHAAARAADAVRVGQRLGLGALPVASCATAMQARHAATLLVLAPHQIARTLGRDQHHVEVLARLDLPEVDVEAVREQQRRALFRLLARCSLYSVLLRQYPAPASPPDPRRRRPRPAPRPSGRPSWPCSSCRRTCARRPRRRSRCPSG